MYHPMTRAARLTALQLSIRAGLSAALALALADRLQLVESANTVITAVIVTDLSPTKTRQLSRQRLAGTVLGAAVGAAMSGLVPAGPWGIGLGILAVMLLCHLLHLEAAAKLAGFVCGIVLLGHATDPWTYGWHRLLETTVGIGLAVLVSYLPKLIRVDVT